MAHAHAMALTAAVLFFALGAAVVVLLPWFHRPRLRPVRETEEGAVEEMCRSCRKVIFLHRNTVTMLTSVEKGMAVSARPDLRGRPLGRHICPYCDTPHYYVVEGNRYTFAGTSFFEPRVSGATCASCGKALATPPWPEGACDGRLRDTPRPSPDYGLVCMRCHAVNCVACTATVSPGLSGEFRCPRCGRGPVDRFFHPNPG